MCWRTLHPSLQSFPCLLGGRVIGGTQEWPHGLFSHHHRGRNAGVSSKENLKAPLPSLGETPGQRGATSPVWVQSEGPVGSRLEATCDHSVTSSVLTDRCVPHTDRRRQQCAEPSGNKASPSGVLARGEGNKASPSGMLARNGQCAVCVFK